MGWHILHSQFAEAVTVLGENREIWVDCGYEVFRA